MKIPSKFVLKDIWTINGTNVSEKPRYLNVLKVIDILRLLKENYVPGGKGIKLPGGSYNH